MSVSTGGEVNVDLRAVVEGGEAFFKRLSDLQSAKMGAEDAISKLGLAQNVHALLSGANEKAAKAAQILSEAEKEVERILENAKGQAASIVEQAKTEAGSIKSISESNASNTIKSADNYASSTKAAAKKSLDDAEAIKISATKTLTINQASAADLAIKHDAVNRLMAEAQATKEDFVQKITAIQTTAAAVLK